MEANKDIIPEYKEDMCPETLDRLSRVVYIDINPDDNKDMLDEKIKIMKDAINHK